MNLPILAFVDAAPRVIFTNNQNQGSREPARLAISAPATNNFALDGPPVNYNVYLGLSNPDLSSGNADYTLAPNSGPTFVQVPPGASLYGCSDSGAPVVISDPAVQGWPRVAALLEESA